MEISVENLYVDVWAQRFFGGLKGFLSFKAS